MLARIHITLKKDVLDPQGKVIANSLSNLGFEGIQSVRQGKYIEIMLDGNDKNWHQYYFQNYKNNLLQGRLGHYQLYYFEEY